METVEQILNLFAPMILGLGLVFAVVVLGAVFLDQFMRFIYDTYNTDEDADSGMFGGLDDRL